MAVESNNAVAGTDTRRRGGRAARNLEGTVTPPAAPPLGGATNAQSKIASFARRRKWRPESRKKLVRPRPEARERIKFRKRPRIIPDAIDHAAMVDLNAGDDSDPGSIGILIEVHAPVTVEVGTVRWSEPARGSPSP